MRHVFNKLHRMGLTCGLLNLLAGVFTFGSVSDVIGDGVVKQMYVLRNQGKVTTQIGQLVITHIVPIKTDRSTVDIIETSKQIRDGRFT
ncbi:Uncharacterised protein [Vibrio cholerae]|uniref:Uncharacterized protein n=1 Tax=Vibrio cholerae TaxID=666 RepID=A0A655P4Y6_VIBCL|nr:Uncharacterised protein [Vibrio cholerae]CSA00342.1 Uncharacterised protein [Vibrio cholerae]CSA14686.1 Uncharacterised protein [Vibrio cholerae]CSB17990.1 Uncharacterised protein [Vibrio cholerae]CSB90643.1 Uncharacterised protein [Vibrio cholerae]